MQTKIRRTKTRVRFSEIQIKEIEELASCMDIEKVAEQFGMGEETFRAGLERQKAAMRAYKKGKAIGAIREAEKLRERMQAGDLKATMFFSKLYGFGSGEQNYENTDKISSSSAFAVNNKPLGTKDKKHMDVVQKQSDKNVINLEASREIVDKTFGHITKDEQEQYKLLKMIMTQVAQTYYTNDDLSKAADDILSHIQNIKPQDHIEVMLVTQMIATHNIAMRNFNRAAVRSDSKDFKIQELGNNNLNLANKLTRTFATQMEALNRYRGKGQQKMIIEHVNISDGGQAVIGNLNSNKKVKA